MSHLFKSRETYVVLKKIILNLSPIYLPYLATKANIYPRQRDNAALSVTTVNTAGKLINLAGVLL